MQPFFLNCILWVYLSLNKVIYLLQSHHSLTSGPAWCPSLDSTNTKMAVGTEEGFVCLLTITEEGPEYLKVLDKQVCGWFRFLDEIVKHSVHYRPVALEGKKYYFWKWDFSH